ncbi:DUF5710 domain-containing protein [Cardiobacterium hominis]|jgi:hypothetical protein
MSNRIYLDVSYADKNHAKTHGARWDGDKRSWYFLADDLAQVPEELRQYLPEYAQVVRSPYDIRKTNIAMMLEKQDALYDAFLAQYSTTPMKITAEWPSADDKAEINRLALELLTARKKDFPQRIRDTQGFSLDQEGVNTDQVLKEVLYHYYRDTVAEATEHVWKAVSQPFFEHYFDCLDTFDLEALPHGHIGTDETFHQGELEIRISTNDGRPSIRSIRDHGELRFDRDKNVPITYGGRSIDLAERHPRFVALQKALMDKNNAATAAKLAPVVIDDEANITRKGDSYVLITKNGHRIEGFCADGGYFILRVDGETIGDCPAKRTLCDDIARVFGKS